MGLASCFMGFVPAALNGDKAAREWLGIPEGNEIYGAMVVGDPAVKYRRLVERKQPQVRWL